MQPQPNRPPRIAFFVILCLVAASARAQNTTFATAAFLTVGQIPNYFNLANNTDQRWYLITVRAGRSYCAGATTAEFETNQADPVLTVLKGDGTTVIGTNDNIVNEPDAPDQSRVCFINPAGNGFAYIKATQNTNASRYYHMRTVETTMFCPWFFIAGDYNAFTLIRNTTDSSLNATVNWRNGAGAIVGTTNVVVPGNGNLALNANTFVNNATTSTGSIEIVHNGSEEALTAGTTTLSPTTGIGFDAIFERRRPW